jgi:hypothetical protein
MRDHLEYMTSAINIYFLIEIFLTLIKTFYCIFSGGNWRRGLTMGQFATSGLKTRVYLSRVTAWARPSRSVLSRMRVSRVLNVSQTIIGYSHALGQGGAKDSGVCGLVHVVVFVFSYAH